MSEVPATEAKIEARVVLIDAYWVKEYLTQHILTNVVSSRLVAITLGLASAGLM